MSLDLWDIFKTPPPEALKKIEGGRLSGKTDINPVWRLRALTERFGPCGIGWKYEIAQTWIVDAPDGQKLLYMHINLYVKEGGEWSEPIPGFGGDFLVEKERAGLHANDEAFKMAETDALGNAAKKLGVAADVYWAAGSKYTREKAPSKPQDTTKTDTKPHAQGTTETGATRANPQSSGGVTKEQVAEMAALAAELRLTDQAKVNLIKNRGVATFNDLTEAQAADIIKSLKEMQKAQTKG